MTNEIPITNSPLAINGLDVVKQVDEFYSTAFDHLLWLLGTLIILLGIVIPLAFYFFQKRQLALKEQALTEYLKTEVSRFEKSFRDENQKFVDGLGNKIKGEVAHAKAGVCLVQENVYWSNGRKKDAMGCHAWVIKLLAETADRKQTQRQLRYITEQIFPRVNRNDFDEEVSKALTESVNIISEIKANGLFDLDIENYKKALAAAQTRN
jgi:hypothetical protein